MKKNIKIITDSASDVPTDDLIMLDIDMLSIPIAIDGESYYERESFDFYKYYDLLENAKEIPVTSRVPQYIYLENYEKNYQLGFRHLVVVTISSTGSGTITSAQMAKDEFYELHPEAKDTLEIHIVDSLTYAMAYGWAVIEAAKMADDHKDITAILSYLKDWFQNVEIFLGCYTLKYAQKSGRINSATAFIGEVLGMRPIILMKDGYTKNVAKVRGDNKVVTGIFEQYKQNYTAKDTAFLIAGSDPAPAKELQMMIKKEYKIVLPIYQAGASIVTNAGPKLVAICCKQNNI